MEDLHGSKYKRNRWACFQFIFSHKQFHHCLIFAVVFPVARPQENLCDTTRGHRAWMCCAHYIACLQFVSDINYIKSQTSIQASQPYFPLWQFWVHVSPHFCTLLKKNAEFVTFFQDIMKQNFMRWAVERWMWMRQAAEHCATEAGEVPNVKG